MVGEELVFLGAFRLEFVPVVVDVDGRCRS